MSRNYSSKAAQKRSRWITFAWVGGLSILTVTLLMLQQTAVLYVLSTLGVTALLVIVALADLNERHNSDTPLGDNSAALGSNIPGAKSTFGNRVER